VQVEDVAARETVYFHGMVPFLEVLSLQFAFSVFTDRLLLIHSPKR
jgi:hypothetical protein